MNLEKSIDGFSSLFDAFLVILHNLRGVYMQTKPARSAAFLRAHLEREIWPLVL